MDTQCRSGVTAFCQVWCHQRLRYNVSMRVWVCSWGVVVVLLAACATSRPCDAVSCPVGCCDANGLCQVSNEISCGASGSACVTCVRDERCTGGACAVVSAPVVPFDAGSGGGSGGSGGSGHPSDAGAVADGGVDAGEQSFFTVETLDANARGVLDFAVAFDESNDGVGVAYFTPSPTQTVPGVDDFRLQYVSWRRGGGASAPELIAVVQRMAGVSIAFDSQSADVVVGYLGGSAGTVANEPVYWFQSDAVISRRTNGSWVETTVARTGDQVSCGNPGSDRGFLVGLAPAVSFDPNGTLRVAYRDVHDAQFPFQDWSASDIELWEGRPTLTGSCVLSGANAHDGAGGHLALTTVANPLGLGRPAIVYDRQLASPSGPGTDVIFQQRGADGGWSTPLDVLYRSDTQTGASFGWNATVGFGVAAVDRATNSLGFVHSTDGVAWSAADVVFEGGSGGWYPSLSMKGNTPTIAFYVCSPRAGVSEQSCLTSEDQLRLAERFLGSWRHQLVDAEGGYQPKVGLGGRVIVYRTPPALDPVTLQPRADVGALRIAVQ